MANPASALGEAVGKSVEREVQKIITNAVRPFKLFVDTGGSRPGVRSGEKLLLVNDTKNQYQIDIVVEDKHHNPLILVESKYIRYKKHNRDKASWTCVAHFKLRTTYPSVKKSIAILMGNWSAPSKKLMESFGIELIEVKFSKMVSALRDFGVDFNWDEKDSKTPKKSWRKYNGLSEAQKREIARKCIEDQKSQIEANILEAVNADPEKPRNINQIELLIKTSLNEYYVKRFTNTRDTLGYLLSLIEDKRDLKGLIK